MVINNALDYILKIYFFRIMIKVKTLTSWDSNDMVLKSLTSFCWASVVSLLSYYL